MIIQTRAPTDLPSAHQLGDVVSFNPSALFNPKEEGTPCLVLRVAFEEDRVLYGLAPIDQDGSFCETYPFRSVYSHFVQPDSSEDD